MNNISIIVPVYNSEEVISRCIESLINQTYTKIEIIIINDGSTDSSGDICDLYSKRDNRVKVIHKINEGVSIARNLGIKESTCEYIIFVDSDDYVSLNMCERLLKKIQGTNYDMVVGGYQRNFTFNNHIKKVQKVSPNISSINSREEFKLHWGNLFSKSLFNAPWGKLYKSVYLKEHKVCFNEDLDCGEDLLFNLDVLGHIDKIGIVNEIVYFYISTENESLSNKYNEKKTTNDKLLYNVTINYLIKQEMLSSKNTVSQIYMRSCFRTFEQILYTNHKLPNKRTLIKEILICRETLEAIDIKECRNMESFIYSLVLHSKSYLIISLFTKIRLLYKTAFRKGLFF
jgi:glycosyltransferase involved in cell wall biosynthesis